MILGVILPIYTIIDMVETAENVWSDCCICAVVDKSTPGRPAGAVASDG
jgi:Na+/H+-dicarboxylate symporter